MTWLMVFSACLAAVLVVNGVTAIVVALVVGRQNTPSRPDPVQGMLAQMPEYPVGEDGNLKGMEPETDEPESENLRL